MAGAASKASKAAPPGEGSRFKALVASGVSPELAAWIGRKKYGKATFQKMAAAGRKTS